MRVNEETLDFDVLTAGLDVPTLLEASAGTGKTFSLKHLAMRLVVERGIPVDRMLVVTFTKAAAAELRTRIRAHFAEALAWLEGGAGVGAVSDLIRRQCAAWCKAEGGAETARERLRESLGRFDEASIVTIHSFCEKALRTHAFSASGPMAADPGRDDGAIRREVVEDFLRRTLDNLLTDKAVGEDALKELLEGERWEQKLGALLSTPAELVERVPNPGRCKVVEDVLRSFLKEAPERVRELKRERNVQTFDDMLFEMWQTLLGDTSGRFRQSLRGAFEAVLIDEFQDTDPLQYEIFRMLFLEGEQKGRALFFVGDPKQAIYQFRSADLNTYLRAREDLSSGKGRVVRLGTNFRSAPRLVEAVNRYFSLPGPGSPFLREELAFHPVKAGSPKPGLLVRESLEAEWTEDVPFEIWHSDGPAVGKSEGRAAMDRAVAQEIARLITMGARGLAALPWNEDRDAGRAVPVESAKWGKLRRLEARDIAILIRKRSGNGGLFDALTRANVRVRLVSREDVLRTEEADDVLSVLRAMAQPGDERLLRAAAAGRLVGKTLSELTDESEALRVELRETFENARSVWLKSGVAIALSGLFGRSRLLERLLPVAGGERRLANYNHIAELLHEAGRRYHRPAGLIAWFEKMQRTPAGDSDERTLRLESEENVVSIVTIHSSKGLEYPIVFLPDDIPLTSGSSDVVFREFNPQTRRLELLLSHKKAKRPEACAREEREENTRLAYVALTRASAKVVLSLVQSRKSSKTPDEWHASGCRSAYYDILLQEGEVTRRTVEAAWDHFRTPENAAFFKFRAIGEAEGIAAGAAPVGEIDAERAASLGVSSSRRALPGICFSSFTGLTRMMGDDEESPRPFAARQKLPLGEDIVSFPRGPREGDALHRVLEIADFSAFKTKDSLEAGCLLARPVLNETLSFAPEEEPLAVRAVGRMLGDVLGAEILPGLRLCDIPRDSRAAEMPFCLSLDGHLSVEALGRALERISPDYAFPGITRRDLQGFLTGFIDLFFGANGRFWILDWKSNAIADTPEGFTREAMAREMTWHHYRLQYLLYAVAARRFLKARLREAFSDDLIGGAIYVFLRGVRKDEALDETGFRRGVVFDPLEGGVVRALDRILAEGVKEEIFEELGREKP